MRKEAPNHKTIGISLRKNVWEALDQHAKDLGTNPHRLAADAIRSIVTLPLSDNLKAENSTAA